MPDFSTYTALMAQPDIAAKRTYDANNLKYAQSMAEFAEKQAEKQAAALEGIGDYFSQVDEQINELLPEDMARVKAVWDKNKGEVITKLSEYGNDPDMFMKLGGATTVKKFVNDLYRSPEMQNAINTKAGVTAYLKDAANPKLEHRAVSWTNANGETVTGDFATWTKAHKSGEAVDLKYNGAYEKPKIADIILKVQNTPNGGKNLSANQLTDLAVLEGNDPADVADYFQKAERHILDPKDKTKTLFNWGRHYYSGNPGSDNAEKQQNALQRYKYLKEGITTNPELIGQMIINQPYQGGIISGYTIRPKGTLTQVGRDMNSSTDDVAVIEYQVKNKRGTFETKTDDIPLNKENGYGFQIFNKLANINKEGTAQSVSNEDINFIYKGDPDYSGSGTQSSLPTNPNVGDTFQFADGLGKWNGTKWVPAK